MSRSAYLGLIVLVGACGGGNIPAGDPPQPVSARYCVQGQVRVTGSDRDTRVLLRSAETGATLTVTGPLRPEIRRLSGGEVEVCGERADAFEMPTLNASSFTLLRMDGMEAHMGFLRVGGEGWVLMVGTEEVHFISLASVSGPLADAQDQVVWVAGRWDGDAFTVRSYGVLGPWRRPSRSH